MIAVEKRKGFTLIEVVVVIGIMATLVGIMLPFIYRVWESNEIEVTRERMSDLKKAMVGDPKLVQNGVRINYGFVGDNGQLPSDIHLTTIQNYLPAGFDEKMFKEIPSGSGIFIPIDAWGNAIVYTPVTMSGRRVSATLRSAGPNGIIGEVANNDDLDENPTHKNYTPDALISVSEVTPTNVVQGNLNFVFFSTVDITRSYSAKVRAIYNLDGADTTTDSGCIVLNIGPITANVPKPFTQSLPVHSNFSVNLPIGKIRISSILYTTADCSGSGIQSPNEIAVFVSDGLNVVSVNLPTINYTIM